MGLLGLAILFLLISVLAGLFGFTGVAGASSQIAKIFFGIFLFLFIGALILALLFGTIVIF